MKTANTLVGVLGGMLLLVSGTNSHADFILVEPPGSPSVNSFPITTSPITWQQVYDNSFFGSDPVIINAFAFRAATTASIILGATTVRMSTTTTEPGSMSSTFASNRGANHTLVASIPIFSPATTLGSYWTISLDSPFLYDPTEGNLLIDISHDVGIFGGALTFDSYNPTPSGLERVVVNSFGAATGTSIGFGESTPLSPHESPFDHLTQKANS